MSSAIGKGVRWLAFAAIGVLLVWIAKQLVKLLAKLALWSIGHPRTTIAIIWTATAVWYLGWQYVVGALVLALVAASTWKAAHSSSFDRTLGAWARTWWRRWWVYRRTWAATMNGCGLSVQVQGEAHPAKLVKVSTTEYWDRLQVRLLVGQELGQAGEAIGRLRVAYGAPRVHVTELNSSTVGIDLMRRDPLLDPVPPTPIPPSTTAIDWRRVPVGRDEFGGLYTVSLLGGHTSVAGSTGAGKAGVGWNVLRGIAPALVDGTVRVILIDPKAKELRQGRVLAADADYAVAPDDVLALLERTVAEMAVANERDAVAGERDFIPSIARPLTLIIIDELAPLLKYWPRSIRAKIDDCLGLLLTQGRGVGYIVLGSIQEPTKDVFTIRDLFTRRIALRLPTESHTDAALIEDAIKYGAGCHQISETLPGLLFSLQDGAKSTARARLGYVQDGDIAELVAYVQAGRNVVSLDSHRPALTVVSDQVAA